MNTYNHHVYGNFPVYAPKFQNFPGS